MKNATAVVTFHAESYSTSDELIRHFQETIQGIPDFFFQKAYINSIDNRNDDSYLLLHAKNGFILNVTGLKPGSASSNLLIDLLNFCEIEVNDETRLTILTRPAIQLLLWNKAFQLEKKSLH